MLVAVFILIAIRQVGRFNLTTWEIMLGGAAAVFANWQIALPDAIRALNPGVMFFLFGMFVVGEDCVESDYLVHIAPFFLLRKIPISWCS